MARNGKLSAAIALCTVVGMGLTGCDEAPDDSPQQPPASDTAKPAAAKQDAVTGPRKIKVDGRSVNVSCSGALAPGKPVIVLVLGLGDGLDKAAGLQKTLSAKNRVCSYDRLGEGASDQPPGPQTVADTGRVLTGVLEQVAGTAPVVLAGHSFGGAIVGRYAPDHQDRVKGVVLMDATSPTQTADLNTVVPASATGPAAELKAQTLAGLQGQNPEQLILPDGNVASAGDIPVEVIEHGKQYFAASVPQYGQALEQAWSAGEHKWLGLSSKATLSIAQNSEHYIYIDRPDLAVAAIERVAAEVG